MKKVVVVLMIFMFLAGCNEKKPPVEISEDIYEFQFELEGVVYTLPTTVEVFENNGWSFVEEIPGEEIVPQRSSYGNSLQKDGVIIDLKMRNFSGSVATARECIIIGIDIYLSSRRNAPESFVLSGGISFDSTLNELMAAFGEPTTIEDHYGHIVIYEINYNGYEFWFDSDSVDEKPNSIIINNDKNAEELIVIDENRVFTVPDIVESYQRPTAFGADLYDFIVKFAGEFYQLPFPVQLFLDDGWLFLEESEVVIPAYGELYSVEFRKGNQTVSVHIKNYDKNEQIIENAFIVSLTTGGYGNNLDMELPGGITLGSTKEAIIAAWGEPSERSESTYSSRLEYLLNYSRYYYLTFDEDGRLARISVFNILDEIK